MSVVDRMIQAVTRVLEARREALEHEQDVQKVSVEVRRLGAGGFAVTVQEQREQRVE